MINSEFYGKVRLKVRDAIVFVKQYRAYFLVIFFGFLIRLLVITKFTSPSIFGDETLYFKEARDILHLNFDKGSHIILTQYPPGYPLLISISHLFYDIMTAYKVTLIINVVFSTFSLVFIYLILRQFIDQKSSILFATVLYFSPQLFLYNFYILSENLFIPLVLASIYLVILFFHGMDRYYSRLMVFLFLLLSRVPGVIIFIAFIMILALKRFRDISKKDIFSIMFILAIFILTIFSRQLIAGSNDAPISTYYYSTTPYSLAVSGISHSLDGILVFIRLLINEMDYLIISSFFIFFVLFLYPLLRVKDFNEKFWTMYTYISLALVGTTVLTTMHMYQPYIGGNMQYSVFGRYIDPFVIPIMLVGYVVFKKYFEDTISRRFKRDFLLFFTSVIIIFLATFPAGNYKFGSAISIFYLIYLQNYLSVWWIYVIFLLVMFLIILTKIRSMTPLLLIAFFFLSVYPTLNGMINLSHETSRNSVATYLYKHTDKNSIVLTDSVVSNESDSYYQMFSLVDFWNYGKTYRESGITGDKQYNLIANHDKNDGFNYLISKRIRDYTPVMKFQDYYVYTNQTINFDRLDREYILDVGVNDEFNCEGVYPPEQSLFRWTKGSPKFRLDFSSPEKDIEVSMRVGGGRPEDNPANITLYINGCYLGQHIKKSEDTIITMNAPSSCLRDDFQVLALNMSAWNPKNSNFSEDVRDLGIAVYWIKAVVKNDNNVSDGEVYDFYDNFMNAVIVGDRFRNDDPWGRQVARIIVEDNATDNETRERKAIFMLPGTALIYNITIPDAVNATFIASAGIYPAARTWGGDGVRMNADFRGNAGINTTLSYYGRPEDGFKDIEVPLTNFTGDNMTITLSVANDPGKNEDADWAVWVEPRIIINR